MSKKLTFGEVMRPPSWHENSIIDLKNRVVENETQIKAARNTYGEALVKLGDGLEAEDQLLWEKISEVKARVAILEEQEKENEYNTAAWKAEIDRINERLNAFKADADKNIERIINRLATLNAAVYGPQKSAPINLGSNEIRADIEAAIDKLAGVGVRPTEAVEVGWLPKFFDSIEGYDQGFSHGYDAGYEAARFELVGGK